MLLLHCGFTKDMPLILKVSSYIHIGYDIYYWVTEVLCNQSLNEVACYCKVYIFVAECITSIFKKLEQKHGKILVQRALGYLSLSKNGLSETEMEDLLSLDDHVNI